MNSSGNSVAPCWEMVPTVTTAVLQSPDSGRTPRSSTQGSAVVQHSPSPASVITPKQTTHQWSMWVCFSDRSEPKCKDQARFQAQEKCPWTMLIRLGLSSLERGGRSLFLKKLLKAWTSSSEMKTVYLKGWTRPQPLLWTRPQPLLWASTFLIACPMSLSQAPGTPTSHTGP